MEQDSLSKFSFRGDGDFMNDFPFGIQFEVAFMGAY